MKQSLSRLKKRFLVGAGAVLLSLVMTNDVQAQTQCLPLTLIDAIDTCPLVQIVLNPVVDTTNFSIRNITWSPATGLSSTNTLNTVATTGITDITYYLTISGLFKNNSVVNGNFSAGNTGFSSGYVLGTGGAWGQLTNEGTYAVSTNPQLTHTNFASFGDHTSGTGNMLVVNGSGQANTSVWCQTIAVTPNTVYDFSTWGATCVSSSPGILQFSINGIQLGSPFTLPATTGTWSQFFTTWNSGTATSATICIVNQNTATSGNDFALDDIEFRAHCTQTDSVVIRLHPVDVSFSYQVYPGCEQDSVVFTAINNVPGSTPQYQWSFGDGTFGAGPVVSHVYPTQGNYNTILQGSNGRCSDIDQQTINTNHPLTALFEPDDDSLCLGQTVTFNSNSIGTITQYEWDLGDGTYGTGQIVQHLYQATGTYTVKLKITSNLGCTDTVSHVILVQEAAEVSATVSDSEFCLNQPIRLRGYIHGSGLDSTYWDMGDGRIVRGLLDPTHTFDKAGNYTVTFNAYFDQCPDEVITFPIKVNPYPYVNLGIDTALCPGEPALFFANQYAQGPLAKYKWSTGSTETSIKVTIPGYYWLEVTDENECVNSDTVWVRKACYLDVPNSFTPNGDGLNDYFLPRDLLSYKLTKFEMTIFNRWGQKVFETKSLNGRGWDGKLNGTDQDMGVYIYMIEAGFANGNEESFKGNVTLLR
jgi:gliding motility-associated-like protein